MAEELIPTTTYKPILRQFLPWLAFVVAIVFLAWPLPWLQTWLNIVRNNFIAAQPGFGPDFGDSEIIAESIHFRLLSYEQYADQFEANSFLAKAEVQFPKLTDFLGVPMPDHLVTMVLLPQCEVSHGGLNYLTLNTCNNKLQAHSSFLFIHELTHALLRPDSSSSRSFFLEEGFSEAAGIKFEWGVPFIFDNDVLLYETLRSGEIIPLADLRLGIAPDKYDPFTDLRYAEAGSFVQYLVNRYGIEKFQSLFQGNGDFEATYSQPFEQLEVGWLRSLQTGNLKFGLLMVFGSLLLLAYSTLLINCGWRWIPATLVGWLAVFLWSFLLGTSSAIGLVYLVLYRPEGIPLPSFTNRFVYPIWLPAGMLLAILLGLLLSSWKKSAGRVVLWVVGGGTIVGFVLWPALSLFFA